MSSILERSRTIQEKRRGYSKDIEVDPKVLIEWRDVRTLLSDKYFEHMLKDTEMSKEEFTYALSLEANKAVDEDVWFDTFSEIMESFDYENIDYKTGVNLVALPFTSFISGKLQEVKSTLKNVEVDDKVMNSFVTGHVIEMFNIIGKLVALKLAVYKETHSFESEEQEERFVEFLSKTLKTKEEFYDFYEEYPVAARIATVRTMYCIKNYTAMLLHLEQDHLEVEQFLGVDNLKLTNVKLSTGDSHAQGNSVSVLSFGDKKLVYKPKNLKISLAFESFIEWYVNTSKMMDIRIPKGIYKDEYTYNEYVEQSYCKSEDEVENFYTRYGYLIAICYLMNINDLHLENIVASGEYPVIIDMETLFQNINELSSNELVLELVNYLEVESVTSSFLLPRQSIVGKGSVVDLSALSGRQTETNEKVLAPQNVNTDDFHYEKVTSVFLGGNNIPKYNEDEEVDISKYNLLIYEGFTEFINFIMNNKEEAIKALEVFKGHRIRSLTKSTEKYASMTRFSNHPNYNTDMKYRERLMMNIWAYPYRDKRIVKSEVRDLVFNDIPIFFSRTDSLDIEDSQGIVYKDYFKKTGMERAVEKINGLTDLEVKRQKSMLLASLGILNPYLNAKPTFRDINPNVRMVDCLKQAKSIAQEMERAEFVVGERSSYINIDGDREHNWKMIPMNTDLYNGLSGVAVYFLEMYRRTDEIKYLEKYNNVIKIAIEQVKGTVFQSAFSGWFSPAYPLLLEYKYLGTISDEKYLEFTSTKLHSLSEEEIARIEKDDFLTGIAGIIRILGLLHKTFGNKYVTQDIIDIFVKVMMSKLEEEGNTTINSIGVAHGISGIVYGLVSVGKLEAARAKSMLDKEYNLEMPEKDRYKWCWGLSGMIQSRIAIRKLCAECIDDDQLAELILRYEGVLDKVVNNDTLCHGNGSIITTLRMLYEYTHDEKWLTYINLWLSNVYQSSLMDGYKINKMADIYSKGIFDGYFGLGWMYLYASGTMNNMMLLEAK